jgi:hypothetical protein
MEVVCPCPYVIKLFLSLSHIHIYMQKLLICTSLVIVIIYQTSSVAFWYKYSISS